PGTHQPANYLLPTATVRRRRPRRRRRFRTARPDRVCIRARNPCLFFRFRLLGWYVGLPIGHSMASLRDKARKYIHSPEARSSRRAGTIDEHRYMITHRGGLVVPDEPGPEWDEAPRVRLRSPAGRRTGG